MIMVPAPLAPLGRWPLEKRKRRGLAARGVGAHSGATGWLGRPWLPDSARGRRWADPGKVKIEPPAQRDSLHVPVHARRPLRWKVLATLSARARPCQAPR